MTREEFIEILDGKFAEWITTLDQRFVSRDLCNERRDREEQRMVLIYGAYTFTAVAFMTLVSWLIFG
jgi:hypothetical protein